MLKILIRPKAREDLKKIWHYTYQNWEEKQANNYTRGLSETINRMIDNPRIEASIDDVKEGYRLYHAKHHLVIYRLTP